MRRLVLYALALFAILSTPATAQDSGTIEQRAQDVVAVLQGEAAFEEVFAPAFVAAVPEAQFLAVKGQLEAQLGPLVGLESVEPAGAPGAATIAIRFENSIASGPMQLAAEEPWKIAGLLLNSFVPVGEEELSALEQLQALPGTTNLLFAKLDGSEVLASHNADMPLGIGSTFKLYVLSALARSIANGERDWDDVVPLTERSFPSGQLQNWPEGSPLTLHSLATLMISISDNTATDQLIVELGREAVEAEVIASGHADPEATFPFLTTRETFLLKLTEDEAARAYIDAPLDVRRVSLDGLRDRELDLNDASRVFANGPRLLEIEWFASPADIAGIFTRLAEDPVAREIMAVNTGIGTEPFADWDYAGYKGGSEPGVLNFSWLLRDDAGAYWVLTMGWNDPQAPVSDLRFISIARGLLAEAAEN
ncbi:serine hydrolase [Alteraurantiacibacter aquimixticola]|nr:serine hydrolase [Alteraurantiacibacter aquimixticola]